MKFLTLLFLSFLSLVAFGQDSSFLRKDSLAIREYRQAVYWTKNGRHDLAKSVLLKQNPRLTASSILLGRLYSWDRQFDSARIFLKEGLVSQPGSEEAWLALIHNELWSGHADQALVYCQDALSRYPYSEKLLIQQSKAYAKLGRYKEAHDAVEKALQLNPSNGDAFQLEKYLNRKIAMAPKNGVGVAYQYDHFNQLYAPWNYGSFYFFHKGKGGGLAAAVNYADRFRQSGVQYELNVYPRISSSLRGWLGAAYSSDSVFPGWNVGAGLSQALFQKIEVEAGARYLTFYTYPDPVLIYTGAFNISLQRLWVSVRTYLAAKTAGTDQSYYLTTRYYFRRHQNSVTLVLNTGSFPHDYLDPVSGKAFNYATRSQRIKLGYQTTFLSTKNILKFSVGYERRDYYSGLTLERATAGIGIERLF